MKFALEACDRPVMTRYLRRLFGELFSLHRDLSLLFLDRVQKHNRDAVILNTLNLSLGVVRDKQRLDPLDIFGSESEIAHTSIDPAKGDRAQLSGEIQAGIKRGDSRLIAKA